jgi:hypothetical protein
MASAWVTVVGTLGGAIVGGLAGVGGQWLQWRRDRTTRWDTSRKEIYAQFLGTSERTQEALWRVVYGITHRRSSDQLSDRWREANRLWSEMTSQRELVILFAATRPTANAAQAVTDQLRTFKDEIYTNQHEGATAQFKTEDEYQKSFAALRDGFLQAAKTELGIAGAIEKEK